jgi:hypothetical protein
VPEGPAGDVAEVIDPKPSRVNFFLNKFQKLGFIQQGGEPPLKINS